MEEWINVFEFNKKWENSAIWLLELLDEEKIPHKEETKECWSGSKKYAKYEQNVVVYVPKEFKEKVESYIKEYNNPNNIIYEEVEELRDISNDEEEFKLTKISKKIIMGIFFGVMIIVAIGIIISSI